MGPDPSSWIQFGSGSIKLDPLWIWIHNIVKGGGRVMAHRVFELLLVCCNVACSPPPPSSKLLLNNDKSDFLPGVLWIVGRQPADRHQPTGPNLTVHPPPSSSSCCDSSHMCPVYSTMYCTVLCEYSAHGVSCTVRAF